MSNFWRTLEVHLNNWKTELILTLSENCVISSAIGKTKFTITDTKFYVPVAALSFQDNANLLEQLKQQLTGININRKFQ